MNAPTDFDATPIHSLEEYVAKVRELTLLDERRALWFRGEANDAWKLVPSLLREPYDSDPRRFERNIGAIFKEHAPAYCREPASWIDWQVLMQHHGCPTRLLDWTESALAALYFVVCRLGRVKDDGMDGIVYALDPHKLSLQNSDARLHPGGILTSGFMKGAAIKPVLGRGAFAAPLPLLPAYSTPRALAQKSRFTLFPFDKSALERQAPPVLFRIRVVGAAKATLFWQLKECGVTATTLFPDLEALAREVRCHLTSGADTGQR
jgi:hypothetical protein